MSMNKDRESMRQPPSSPDISISSFDDTMSHSQFQIAYREAIERSVRDHNDRQASDIQDVGQIEYPEQDQSDISSLASEFLKLDWIGETEACSKPESSPRPAPSTSDPKPDDSAFDNELERSTHDCGTNECDQDHNSSLPAQPDQEAGESRPDDSAFDNEQERSSHDCGKDESDQDHNSSLPTQLDQEAGESRSNDSIPDIEQGQSVDDSRAEESDHESNKKSALAKQVRISVSESISSGFDQSARDSEPSRSSIGTEPEQQSDPNLSGRDSVMNSPSSPNPIDQSRESISPKLNEEVASPGVSKAQDSDMDQVTQESETDGQRKKAQTKHVRLSIADTTIPQVKEPLPKTPYRKQRRKSTATPVRRSARLASKSKPAIFDDKDGSQAEMKNIYD